jgi:hypothetical protein
MAGLQWIRLDTTIFENPKLLYLQEDKRHRAIVAHLQAMCYSGRHGLDGFIPKAALRVIGASVSDSKHLVAVKLWDLAQGGWQINDWNEYQPSSIDEQKRRERAQKGAVARWAKEGKIVNLHGVSSDERHA